MLQKTSNDNVVVLSLSPQFQTKENLQTFVEKISFFRKFSPENLSEVSTVADFPMLAKHFARSNL